MKLKNALRLAFITLTLIPIIIVSMLLYKSGFELSKKSYANNLNESIHVQVDFLSQEIESSMIYDKRFTKKYFKKENLQDPLTNLNEAFQTYLDFSEDSMSVSMFVDKNQQFIYSMGEQMIADRILTQIPDQSNQKNQHVLEFRLSDDVTSLGILTPVWDHEEYIGAMISVFDKSHISKMISSYYDISNASIYLCKQDGSIIKNKGNTSAHITNLSQTKDSITLDDEGEIDLYIDGDDVMGYYKAIHNTPWYLVGMIDNGLIYSFTNQFIYVYILIIALIFIADIILAIYFTNRVVRPINGLINLMDKYHYNLDSATFDDDQSTGFYETTYLKSKFFELMKNILLAQHNFKGIYQLYQSNDMEDINVDIDVKQQSIQCNKESFNKCLENIVLQPEDCVVENFVKCFCKVDEDKLRTILENMRDHHLATSVEEEAYMEYQDGRWYHLVIVPLYEDDRLSRLFIQLRNISNFKKQEIASNLQVRKDSLTGLYNRFGLLDYVENLIETTTNQKHGVLFVDIDYFKLVNDYFGHQEGDQLLCKIADTLLKIIDNNGIVSRLGGDEFVIFIPNIEDTILENIKQEIEQQIQYPYTHEKKNFNISASVGESIWDVRTDDCFNHILAQADHSMYEAKRKFKEHR